jgi:hypothetical protein
VGFHGLIDAVIAYLTMLAVPLAPIRLIDEDSSNAEIAKRPRNDPKTFEYHGANIRKDRAADIVRDCSGFSVRTTSTCECRVAFHLDQQALCN